MPGSNVPRMNPYDKADAPEQSLEEQELALAMQQQEAAVLVSWHYDWSLQLNYIYCISGQHRSVPSLGRDEPVRCPAFAR